jgi:hypothetical protein
MIEGRGHGGVNAIERAEKGDAAMGHVAMANVKATKRAVGFIVVIGMSAALAVLGLGGMTGKGLKTACDGDATAVETAVVAFHVENPDLAPTPKLLTSHTDGGPFLTSWPKNGGTFYAISVTPAGVVMVSVPSTARAVSYDSANGCSAVS